MPAGGSRDPALILTLGLGGLRVAEACALNRVDLDGKWLWVWHGKGDKERRIPVHPRLNTALRAYLSERSDGHPAMFVSRLGNRLSARAAREAVVSLVVKSGIVKLRDGRPVSVSPHKLRHTAGTLLAQAKVPTHRIMEILGHADEATAHIYMAETAGPDDMAAIEGIIGPWFG